MNRKQLEIRASEIRSRMVELGGSADALNDAQRGELDKLTGELQDVEVRRRAAIAVEPEPVEVAVEVEDTGEGREVRTLRQRCRIGEWIAAAIDGRAVTGAEAEYSAAHEVSSNTMPLAFLDGPRERAVSAGPTAGTQKQTRETIPYVFERSAAAALGIQMPMVQPGQSAWPAITTAPPAGYKAAGSAADSTAAVYTVTNRTPKRLTGAFQVRQEDVAMFSRLETDLRATLSDAMSDAMDDWVFSNSSNDLFTTATDVSADGTTIAFDTGIKTFSDMVDGKHAYGLGDIRAVVGSDTFGKFAATFQTNGELSLWDYLGGKLGSIRVSDRVPAKASNAQKGIAVLGAGGSAIRVPIWRAIRFIRDEYTDSTKAMVTVTAMSLVGDVLTPYGSSQVVEIHPKIS